MTRLKRPIFIFLFTILFCALVSCDPYGGYEYWVDNKSDSIVFVVLREEYADNVEKISIEPNSLTLLKKYETINGLNDYGDNFLKYWDSLAVMIDTTSRLTIKKDYLERESWTYTQNKTGQVGTAKSGNNIYRLEINADDLK